MDADAGRVCRVVVDDVMRKLKNSRASSSTSFCPNDELIVALERAWMGHLEESGAFRVDPSSAACSFAGRPRIAGKKTQLESESGLNDDTLCFDNSGIPKKKIDLKSSRQKKRSSLLSHGPFARALAAKCSARGDFRRIRPQRTKVSAAQDNNGASSRRRKAPSSPSSQRKRKRRSHRRSPFVVVNSAHKIEDVYSDDDDIEFDDSDFDDDEEGDAATASDCSSFSELDQNLKKEYTFPEEGLPWDDDNTVVCTYTALRKNEGVRAGRWDFAFTHGAATIHGREIFFRNCNAALDLSEFVYE